MTANELLVLLGRVWSCLLLYPSGLTCFALLWLVALLKDRTPWPWRTAERWNIFDMSVIVAPWVAIAMLPLPNAVGLSRSLDIVVVLALLEWPALLTIGRGLSVGNTINEQAAVGRLAGMLNGYPAFVAATLVCVAAADSFELQLLAQPPGELAPSHAALLHWLGAVGWLLALPPLLGIGSFAVGRPAQLALRVGLGLRAIGLVFLCSLPWFRLLPERSLWLLLPPLLIALGLAGYARLTDGQSRRRWGLAYVWLDGLLLLLLLWDAAVALQRRLT